MLTLVSPAKINLFLRVLSRRPDGYHELASLFQAIDLHDKIHFALADFDLLECSFPGVPTDRSNLIWKALDLYRRKTGFAFCLHVKIEKNIPPEAGLGGGSSNAATALWAVNQLLGYPVPLSELQTWSSEIGSDIPFFFSSGTAYCTGRGEIVESLNALSPQTICVAKPNLGLSTPKVYQQLNLSTLKQRDPLEALRGYKEGIPEYFNDLEESALSLKPELRQFKQKIINLGYKTVMLSGSGSSFFCIGKKTLETIGNFYCQTTYLNRVGGKWYPYYEKCKTG